MFISTTEDKMETYNPPDPAYIKYAKTETTITIRKKGSGRIVLIQPDQFDENLHEKVDAQVPAPTPSVGRVRSAAPAPEVDAEPPFEVSEHSESDLAVMSTAELKQLPEFARVKTTWRNKQELVQAILVARLKVGDGGE